LELLIVIAIIAVLAALLLSAWSSAQNKARQAKCTNNVYQLGTALQEFATEYRVFPPAFIPAEARANHPEYHINWQYALNGQLSTAKAPPLDGKFSTEDTPGPDQWVGLPNGPKAMNFWGGVWACPAARPPPNLPDHFGMTSYGYNVRGLGEGLQGLGGTSLTPRAKAVTAPAVHATDIVSPSGMIAIGDGFEGNNGNVDELAGLYRRNTNAFGYYSDSTRHAAARHGARATIAFCDDHVESLTFHELFQDTNDAALRLWNRDNQPHREDLEP